MSSSRLRSSLATNKTSSSFNTSEISELSGNEESSAQFDSSVDEQRRASRQKPAPLRYEESMDDVFEDEGVNVSGSGDEDFIKTIVLEGKPPWGFTIVDESSQGAHNGRRLSDSSKRKLTPNYIVQKVFPRSIATRADLCEGDVLLFINDLTANELNIDDLNMLINTSPKLKIIVTSASPQVHVSQHVLNTQRMNTSTTSSSGNNKKTIRIGSSSSGASNQSTNKLINNPYFNAGATLNGSSLAGANSSLGHSGHHHHHHHRHAQPNSSSGLVGAGSNAYAGVLGNNNNNNNSTINANDFLKSLHQHFETTAEQGGHASHHLASSSLNNFNNGSLNANNLLANAFGNGYNTHKPHHHSHNTAAAAGSQNYLNYHNQNHQQHHHHSQKNLLNYSKTNDNLNINSGSSALATHPRYRTSSLNSNYRNYFSATESCGEDCDDNSGAYSHQPRRRFNNNFENKFLTSKLDQINTNFVNSLGRQSHQQQQHQIPSSHRYANHFARGGNQLNASLLANSNNQSAGLDDSFEKKNVSYASINLKQPLKDYNYFSDSEGASNRIKYRTNSTPSASLKQQQKLQLQQQQGQPQAGGIEPLTQEQIAALDSVFGADTPQPSETPTNFGAYSTNYGAGNTMNMNSSNNSFQFSLPQYQQQQQQNVAKSAHGFSKLNSFNSKPQGFVPYGQEALSSSSSNSAAFQSYDKYGGSSWGQQQAQQGSYSPGMLNKSSNNSYGYQPQQPQQQQQHAGKMQDESYYIQQLQNQYQQQQQRQAKSEYVDPMEAKYEREMGSELHKPLSKQNYSDSYFYNSSVFNYPTIDDQKKLAKSIADTLEGSNPQSKYHKKKQTMFKDGYESETPASPTAAPPYGGGSYDFNHHHHQPAQQSGYAPQSSEHTDIAENPAAYYQKYYEEYTQNLNESNNEDPVIEKYVYDETLPEVIKRSIAQASMTDPVRMVQAPDSFKQAHFTEHTTHTQMPPKAAMSLAAALESEQANGGRGAQIFQKRKQRSEKWVVDESNVKKNPYGFPVQPTPTQMMPPVEPIQNYNLPSNHQNNQNNKNFLDFNAKPRGWNNYGDPKAQPNQMRGYQDLEYAIKALSEGIDHQHLEKSPSPPSHQQLSSPPVPPSQPVQSSKFDMNPNKIDLSTWSSQQQSKNDENKQPQVISKDGVQNIKAKFLESMSSQSAAASAKKPVKLSSHENYLYNTKNSQLKMQSELNSANNKNSNNSNNSNTSNSQMNYAQRNASGGKFNPQMIASSDL